MYLKEYTVEKGMSLIDLLSGSRFIGSNTFTGNNHGYGNQRFGGPSHFSLRQVGSAFHQRPTYYKQGHLAHIKQSIDKYADNSQKYGTASLDVDVSWHFIVSKIMRLHFPLHRSTP